MGADRFKEAKLGYYIEETGTPDLDVGFMIVQRYDCKSG
jgi:hypothetical protein